MKLQQKRFNSIDFFLLILALAAVLSLFLQGNLSRSIGLEYAGEPAEVTLLISDLNAESKTLLRAGEVLYHPETAEVLGTIRRAIPENSPLYTLDENGEVKTGVSPDSYTVTLVISANGKQYPHGFLINNTHFSCAGDFLPVTIDHKTAFRALVLNAKQG